MFVTCVLIELDRQYIGDIPGDKLCQMCDENIQNAPDAYVLYAHAW